MSSTDAEPAVAVVTPTKTGGTGSSSSTPSKETDEALTQLVQGRRHLLVRDYSSAVAALAKGCELLAVKYGDTAPECGDAYLTYGRALLELARSESGVLAVNEEGAGEDGADEDDEEADGEDGEEADGEDAEDGANEEEDAGGVEAKENGAKENGAKENGAKENGAKVGEASAEGSGSTDDAKEGEGAEEEEEDVNNLQLAWEMLELAKVIFQKQLEAAEDKATALKLSEVYLKLGEVGVESENYGTAIEDIKSCLEIQKQHLEDDDRRIAETLYNLGVAYSLCNEFDSAIEQFKSASDQIEKRIVNLEKRKDKPDAVKSASEDPFYTIQGEIEELKALLPEMKEKVTDMHDFKKETLRRMMDGLAEASARKSSTADGAGPSTASDKPVSSVAHLVKRKPKDESKEDAQVDGNQDKAGSASDDMSHEKKRKQETDTESGDATKKLKVNDSS